MKRQIRYGCFETNSSQCHAISVARDYDNRLKLPKKLVFHFGDFYGTESFNTVEDKASYLYTLLWNKYHFEGNDKRLKTFLKYLKETLINEGVEEVEFEEPKFTEDIWRKPEIEGGYVDTEGITDKFFTDLLYNTRRLKSFLFSKKSIVEMVRDDDEDYTEDFGPRKNNDKVSYDWTWFAR